MRAAIRFALLTMLVLTLAGKSYGDSDLAKAAKKEKERRSKIQHAKVVSNKDVEEFKKTHPTSEGYITVQNQNVEGQAADTTSDLSQDSEETYLEKLDRAAAQDKKFQEPLQFQYECYTAKNRVEQLENQLQGGGIPLREGDPMEWNPKGVTNNTYVVHNGQIETLPGGGPILKIGPVQSGVKAEDPDDRILRLKKELEQAQLSLEETQEKARKAGYPCN